MIAHSGEGGLAPAPGGAPPRSRARRGPTGGGPARRHRPPARGQRGAAHDEVTCPRPARTDGDQPHDRLASPQPPTHRAACARSPPGIPHSTRSSASGCHLAAGRTSRSGSRRWRPPGVQRTVAYVEDVGAVAEARRPGELNVPGAEPRRKPGAGTGTKRAIGGSRAGGTAQGHRGGQPCPRRQRQQRSGGFGRRVGQSPSRSPPGTCDAAPREQGGVVPPAVATWAPRSGGVPVSGVGGARSGAGLERHRVHPPPRFDMVEGLACAGW